MKNSDKNLINYYTLWDLLSVQDEPEKVILWFDCDGKSTEINDEVTDTKEEFIPRKRNAETREDFDQILKREANKFSVSVEEYAPVLIGKLNTLFDEAKVTVGIIKLDSLYIVLNRFIKHLSNQKKEQTFNSHIFDSKKGQNIFSNWYEINKDNIKKVDFDFIYWALKKDSLLRDGTTASTFSDWLPNWDSKLVFGRIQSEAKSITKKRQRTYETIKMTLK
ncbi:hypothetical protein [Kaistella polysaccharea]|uniref:hypothetical protein n=1 Tax=Kaistella polysaccharea TaxID=2878534 RepID=UPI001CF17D44|nr:hypothetical protein [Kaistella polysaccharea]